MDPAPSIANLLRHWHSWRSSRCRKPPDDPKAFGDWGESQAGAFLKRKGWKVLRRNFRAEGGGEVDLVCRDGEVLAFVEVKTRRRRDFGDPRSAVNRKKQRLIIRGALEWLRLLDRPDLTFRFDIVEVVVEFGTTDIRVIESAFHLPDVYRY